MLLLLLLLIVLIDVVIAVVVAMDTKYKNNKTGVRILIEFPWWNAIIGLLLLLLMNYLLCNNFCFVFVTFHKVNNEWFGALYSKSACTAKTTQ